MTGYGMKGSAGKLFVGDHEVAEVGSWALNNFDWKGSFGGKFEGEFEDPGPVEFDFIFRKGWWAYLGRGVIGSVDAEATTRDYATATFNLNGMGDLVKMFRPKFWIYHKVFRMSLEKILKRRKK